MASGIARLASTKVLLAMASWIARLASSRVTLAMASWDARLASKLGLLHGELHSSPQASDEQTATGSAKITQKCPKFNV